MHGYFICMYVTVSNVCLVPVEAIRKNCGPRVYKECKLACE